MYALEFSHKPASVEDEKISLHDFEMSPSCLYKL